jgi:endoglucanase Acf2
MAWSSLLHFYLPDYKPKTEVEAAVNAYASTYGYNGKIYRVNWENFRINTDGSPLFVDDNESGVNAYGFNSTKLTYLKSKFTEVYCNVSSSDTPFQTMLNSTTLRNNMLAAIIAHVVQNAMDGVNVNFEPMVSITGTTKTNFITFMTDLANQLHTYNKKLAFSGHIAWAVPNDNQDPWDSLDYSGETSASYLKYSLTELVNAGVDWFEFQAYDQFYDLGTAHNLVKTKQLQEAIDFYKSKVPTAKIVPILPAYGVRVTPGGVTVAGNSNNLTNTQLNAYSANVFTTASRDADSQLRRQLITGGNSLLFADDTSVTSMRSTAEAKGIKHVSLWLLGDYPRPTGNTEPDPNSIINNQPSSMNPISTINPSSLGYSTLSSNNAALTTATYPSTTPYPTKPYNYFGAVQSQPHKTNTTWMPAIMYDDTARGNNATATYPYTYKLNEFNIEVGCTVDRTVGTNIVLQSHSGAWQIKASETLNRKQLESYSVMGAEFKLFDSANPTRTINTWLVSGQSFLTTKFANLTPVIDCQHAILSINGNNISNNQSFSGSSFKLELNNGQIWKIYTPSSITLTVDTTNWILTCSAVYNSIIKFCYLGKATESANVTANETIHNQYGNLATYVTGGNIDNTTFTGNTANYRITWTKSGTGAIMQYALPHHQDALSGGVIKNVVGYQSMKGNLIGVEGDEWLLPETLPTYSIFFNTNAVQDNGDLLAQLALDFNYTFTGGASTDTYFGYKEIARVAQTVTIADQLGDTGKRATMLTQLKNKLNEWLNFTNSNPLKYDTSNGGVVSADAAAALGNAFGSGSYNDHHFHWGYFFYSCAVAAHFDPAWATTTIKDRVNVLARDMMNPSLSDTYFPLYRCKDWYSGHAWAGGLAVWGDVNNQESISEDINGMYGLMCWAEKTGQTELYNIARLGLQQTKRAGRKYWQGTLFGTNKNIGIHWATKVDYATFFGGYPEYVEGIQMIPWTRAMNDFYSGQYAGDLWTHLLNDVLNRTKPIGGNITNSGAGYTGTDGSYTANSENYVVSNNATTTTLTGTGAGLKVNVNINQTQGGKIWEVFVVGGQEGSGYAEGDTVRINAPGGTGSVYTLRVKPEDGWIGLINGVRAATDPVDGYNRQKALANFDGGTNKTIALAYQSQFKSSAVVSTANQYIAVYTDFTGKVPSTLIPAGSGGGGGSGGTITGISAGYEYVITNTAGVAAAVKTKDGTTLSTSTDIGVVVNAVLATFTAGVGGRMYITPGNYTQATSIIINGPDQVNHDNDRMITIHGAGIDATRIAVATNVTAITISKGARVDLGGFFLSIGGTATGIKANKGSVQSRSFWESYIHDITIYGVSHTAWAFDWESCFRFITRNLHANAVANGMRIKSGNNTFNPGDCLIENSFMELNGTANGAAYQFESIGNDIINQMRLIMVEGYGSDGSGTVFMKLVGTGMYGITATDLNAENFHTILDVGGYTHGNYFTFNYIFTTPGASRKVIKFGASTFNNIIGRVSFLNAGDGNTTPILCEDLGTKTLMGNQLTNCAVFNKPTGTTITGSALVKVKVVDIDNNLAL